MLPREKFTALLHEEGSRKLLTVERYQQIIDIVNRIKGGHSRSTLGVNIAFYKKKYDVLEINGVQRLISPCRDKGILQYVEVDHLYDVIYNAHISTGHGARDRMKAELQTKYSDIPKKLIENFVKLCETCCEKRKANLEKQEALKDLKNEELKEGNPGAVFKDDRLHSARCQVDLIDLNSSPDGEYRYILHYQDHLTKFIILRPLEENTAVAVADQLLDIFCMFGAPVVLESDNGREFSFSVISYLQEMWPELKLVHGDAAHSSTVDRDNAEKMLYSWMEDNKTTRWSRGLKFVQFMKNRSLHSGIKRSPCEAMFGVPARLGLASTTLPASMYEDVTSEEELNEAWISFSQQLPILKRLSGYKIQDDRYPCDQCDHVSPTAYNLKRHVKARHPLYAESIQMNPEDSEVVIEVDPLYLSSMDDPEQDQDLEEPPVKKERLDKDDQQADDDCNPHTNNSEIVNDILALTKT